MLINPPLGLTDRSFNYGDGLFSTILIRQGQPQLMTEHLQRLSWSAQRLGMQAIDEDAVVQAVTAAISAPEQVVKLLLSRGQSGRGYSPDLQSEPHLYLTTAPLPDYRQWQQQGMLLGVAQFKLACQPALAGLKHNNRLEQVLLKAELANSAWDDLLVCDTMNRVTEATAANVFFFNSGRWFTPLLDQAGVAGVMRSHLLQHLEVEQGYFSLSQLEQAEAVLLCNALMQVVPVRQFGQRQLDIEPVRQLQQELSLC